MSLIPRSERLFGVGNGNLLQYSCLWGHKQLIMTEHSTALQRIFLTQRLNLHLLHWQANSLPLSHLGSPIPPILQKQIEAKRVLLIYLSHLTCPSPISVSGTITLGCIFLSKVSATSFESRSLKPSLLSNETGLSVVCLSRSDQFISSVVHLCLTVWPHGL